MAEDPNRRRSGHSLHHAILATMAMALFLFLLWLGMTVIRDSARNSAIIALGLTGLFLYAVIRETAKANRQE
jgi:hypothetical protein